MVDKRKTQILLVEDNETDVKIILRAFEKSKFACDVHIVGDGEEALRYLLNEDLYRNQGRNPVPDIILLDVNMPRMDGHTFVKKVRSLPAASKIPIIVFTKKEGLKDAFRYEGVNDYVVKSINGVDMIGKIKEILKFKDEFFKD